jgi:hypothetical protein
MPQPEINSLEDWESEELSEAELDALAGGQSFTITPSTLTLPTISQVFTPQPLPPLLPLVGDVQIAAKIDSSYSSYLGANGTRGNENNLNAIPFNLTSAFP